VTPDATRATDSEHHAVVTWWLEEASNEDWGVRRRKAEGAGADVAELVEHREGRVGRGGTVNDTDRTSEEGSRSPEEEVVMKSIMMGTTRNATMFEIARNVG
jgi:hypothetical protein